MNGKRYVLVRYIGDSDVDLAIPPGAMEVTWSRYDLLQSDKPAINKVVLRFDSCREAARYAKEYDCPRFKTEHEARDKHDYYSNEEIEQHFGVKATIADTGAVMFFPDK